MSDIRVRKPSDSSKPKCWVTSPASESSGWDLNIVEQKETLSTCALFKFLSHYFMPLSFGVVCCMSMDSWNRGCPEPGADSPQMKWTSVKEAIRKPKNRVDAMNPGPQLSLGFTLSTANEFSKEKVRVQVSKKAEGGMGTCVSSPRWIRWCSLSTYHESDTEQRPRPIGAHYNRGDRHIHTQK